jgi:hypothetical protein
MPDWVFKNKPPAYATLAVDSGTSGATLTLATGHGTRLPAPGVGQISAVRIENELITYTGNSSDVLTGVTRGAGAANHVAGTEVKNVIPEAFLNVVGGGGTPTGIANGGGTLILDGAGNLIGSVPTVKGISLTNADGAGLVIYAGGDTAIYAASSALVRVNQDNSVSIEGGPSGITKVQMDAGGNLTITRGPGTLLKLVNLATSAPGVLNAVWNNGGALAID